MDTRINHEGIALDLQMNDPPMPLRDGTWHHPARVLNSVTRDQLQKLLTLQIWGTPVQGVESFAVERQCGKLIGLITTKKLWEGTQ